MRIQARLPGPIAARLGLVAMLCCTGAGAARAGEAASPGFFDTVLQKLQIKAKPAEAAPDFVQKTRPDAAGLDYMQRPMPHKVSPVPTKSADEVEATKQALDAARDAQLNPPPRPITAAAPAGKRRTSKKAPN